MSWYTEINNRVYNGETDIDSDSFKHKSTLIANILIKDYLFMYPNLSPHDKLLIKIGQIPESIMWDAEKMSMGLLPLFYGIS